MNENNRFVDLVPVLRKRPDAIALVKGSGKYPHISGNVRFYQTKFGVIVYTEVLGLPIPTGQCKSPVFGFHIHSGSKCSGNETDPFADAMTHYNPHDCPHPYHMGDMPSLFGNNGYALLVFFTDRFSVTEVVGKTVIIHSAPDDFTTQPSGNSGEKIACGEIKAL